MVSLYLLFDHDLEPKGSSSLAFGNESMLSYRSLNHDLLTIIDIYSVRRRLTAEAAAVEGVPAFFK